MGAQIKKEISIMKMISHNHVVGVKDVFATATKIFIVLELIEVSIVMLIPHDILADKTYFCRAESCSIKLQTMAN